LEHAAIREFYSLLRAAMIGVRRVHLLPELINDHTLSGIMSCMPPGDWKQWAKERTLWIQEDIEEAFWRFIDQKWRDSLSVAAAKPQNMDHGQEAKKSAIENTKDQTGQTLKSPRS
jgi:hypothetical protein